MPTAMTFNSLIGDLQAYLERGTAADPLVFNQLPKLINDAEREIARAIKIEGFVQVVTTAMAIGATVYPKPDRWRRTTSMWYGAGANFNKRTPLFARSYEYCRTYWPDTTVLADQGPEFYSDYNYENWLIVGPPLLAYPLEIVYWGIPPLLDSVNQTNWLTNYAPTTLRYRTLMECAPFLKDDSRIQTWQELYMQSLSSLNGEDIQKAVDRSATREGD